MKLKISYPNILPFVGGIIGVAMGVSYYIGIMISQLFIGRPSSTWILGVLWLPVFLLKPGLVGVLLGSIVWFLLRPFHQPRSLSPTEIKAIKLLLILLMSASAAAGVIKIIKGVLR
ncbi:MAG: hypothetical protein HZC11_02580 [Nitrospirae bacterium]|nr:hypothetical protein [Nitrospirota bacterium]